MNRTLCSQCDAVFDCGVDELSCWCMDKESIKPINDGHSVWESVTCLCPDCLRTQIIIQKGDAGE